MSVPSLEKFYQQFASVPNRSIENIISLVRRGNFTFCFPTPDRNDYAQIIEKLDKWIGNVINVAQNPYITLKNEYELVHASKVDKLSPKAIQMTINDSSLWIDKDNPRPEYVYRKSLEEEYDSYENRMVRTLIDRLVVFINGPVMQAKYAIKNLYEEYYQSSRLNKFDLVRIADLNTFKVSEDIYFKDFRKLYLFQSKLNFLRNTNFYKTLIKYPAFQGHPDATNLFTHHSDYRACYLMWNYLDTCTKTRKELSDTQYSSLYAAFIFMCACSFLDKMNYKPIQSIYFDQILDDFHVESAIFDGKLFAMQLEVDKLNKENPKSLSYLLTITTLCKINKAKQVTKVALKAIEDDEEIENVDHIFSAYQVNYSDIYACVSPNNENSLNDLFQLLKSCVLIAPVSEEVYTNLCIVCGSNMIHLNEKDCTCESCKAKYTFIGKNLLWIKSFTSNLNENLMQRKTKK